MVSGPTERELTICRQPRSGDQAIREALQCLEAERYDEAILACEQARADERYAAEVLFILGLISFDLDKPQQAVHLIEQAHQATPEVQEFAEALSALHARLGNVQDGLYYAKLATTLTPHETVSGLLPERLGTFFRNLDRGGAHLYLRRAKRRIRSARLTEAITDCQAQLSLTPGDSATLRLLGSAYLRTGRLDQAVAAFHAVLHNDDARAKDLSDLARVLAAAGRPEEAAACHHSATNRSPGDWQLHSRLLADLSRCPDVENNALTAAHAAWRQRHASRLAPRPLTPPLKEKPDRALRIGYLCGDLSDLEIPHLFLPVLEAHRAGTVSTFCYVEGSRLDASTERLARAAHKWTDLENVDDETAWEILRGDEIDVLVDLVGHGEGGRPLLVARRSAPVVASWLGYPYPPAVPGLDYFLSDRHAWPCGEPDPETGEQVWQLPQGLIAYRAPAIMPAIGPLPAASNGYLTFGVQSALGAIGVRAAASWAEALQAVDRARLLICNTSDEDRSGIERCLGYFSHMGLRNRVDIVNRGENFRTEQEFYQHVDLALDTASPASLMETCRALWMGVPVLAVAGKRHGLRLAASLLNAAGRPQWAVSSRSGLTRVAAALASDLGRLSEVRCGLRDAVSTSPLGDIDGFTRSLEDAYRAMWTAWWLGVAA